MLLPDMCDTLWGVISVVLGIALVVFCVWVGVRVARGMGGSRGEDTSRGNHVVAGEGDA